MKILYIFHVVTGTFLGTSTVQEASESGPSLNLSFELANSIILALANFLIEPNSPLAIGQNGDEMSGWGLALSHWSQTVPSDKIPSESVSEEDEAKSKLHRNFKSTFLDAAEKLIVKKFHEQSISEDAKIERLKSLTSFFTKIVVAESSIESNKYYSHQLVRLLVA